MKYIDADKLIAEIKIIRQSLEHRDVRLNKVKKIRTECTIEFCNRILDVITSLQQEQPEVDYNKFEKLFDDFCERNKGHHITSHDACMWFWELGLKARKEE